MPDSLTVHLNRDGPQSIEAPDSVEATGEFNVYLRNHGTPIHAHVRLDRSLSEVARVATPNRYVEEGATRRVRIEVGTDDRPLEGRIEVVTGYGATTERIPVTIRDPDTGEDRIAVDDELGRPTSTPESTGVAPERLLLGALLGVAALLAVVTAVLIEDLLITLGVLVVLVGAAVAGYLVLE